MPLRLELEDGKLVLTQAPFRRSAHGLILGLSHRAWNGTGWVIPLTDLGLVRTTFAGASLEEGPNLPQPERAAPIVETGTKYLSMAESGYSPKTKPFNHQEVAFFMARRKRAFALLMEMGTGKTKVIIDVLSWLVRRGHIDGALIVCPKAVLFNWEREIDTHSPLLPHLRRAVVLEGHWTEKQKAIEKATHAAHFVICNYETFLGGPRVSAKSKAHVMEIDLATMLKRRRFAMVLDESTKVKSHKALQAKAAVRLGELAQARYILTGSPIAQGPLDAFMQFKFLDPNILGHQSYYSFRPEYAVSGGFFNKQVIAYKNLDRLAKLIAPFSYRVLKKDCLDLPEKVYKTIELRMGEEQKAIYKQMRDEMVVELEGTTLTAPIVLTKLLRLSQITSGFLPKINDEGVEIGTMTFDTPKRDALRELLESAFESGQKVIVWCRFIHDLDAVANVVAELGRTHVAYHGEVTTKMRQLYVDKFQAGEVDVFIGQIQTGGIAITLTAASLVIYYSNSYSLEHRLQSEDRAHRIGQTRSVEYVDLLCKGTIDRVVIRALRNKKDLADIVTGDAMRYLAAELKEEN